MIRTTHRPKHVTHPERCADHGHPGVTYHPWHDVTACLCGVRWQTGDRVVWPKADGCGGPLADCTERCDHGE